MTRADKSRPFLDRSSPLPIHRQIESWLRDQISAGVFKPGGMLPSLKVLCEQLGGINQRTVSQAITTLSREGLLFTIPGRGTVVSEKGAKQLRIALVLPTLDEEPAREIARGVQEVLDSITEESSSPDQVTRGAATVVFDSRRNARKQIDNIFHLEDLPLDGAIILPFNYGDLVEHLVRLKADKFPLVLIDSIVPGIEFSSVVPDHYGGGYAVTHHLLEHGMTKLAWIGHCEGYFTARQRYEGFCNAISDFGLPIRREWIYEIQTETPIVPSFDAIESIMERMRGEIGRIQGIVCSNDQQAIMCLDFLKKHGISVPQKVAVVGIDDISAAKLATPPLTTIKQSTVDIGRQAAQLIIERISNPTAPAKKITLPMQLKIRQSCGPHGKIPQRA